MKKIILIILPLLILNGCSQSLIKIITEDVLPPKLNSVRTASGNYFLPVTVGDSVKKLWEADLHGGLSNTTISSYNNYIFVSDLSGWITCININSGKKAGVLKERGGIFSSPVLHNFVLIYPVSVYNEDYSILVYYNFKTGSENKKIKIKGKITGELVKENEYLIFNTEDGNVYKYDFYGEKIWESRTNINTHSSPAVNNGIIAFGNNAGEVIALDEKSGKVIYRKKINASVYGSPSISGDTLYIGDDSGNLYAVKLNKGQIIWRFQSGSRIRCTPVFNTNKIFLCSMNGKLYCLNKNNGNLEWESNLGGLLNATPLLTNNYLVAADLDGKLYLVNTDTGKIGKTIETEGRCKLSPGISGNILIAGYDYNTIAAYEIIK